MKYDVIVGNPPYTHLRNLNNRRYNTYPKQRDMAQVFIRWALDHGNAISFNTSDTWIEKDCDGSKETKNLVNGLMREIITNQNYAFGDGGNIPTFIVCLNKSPHNKIVIVNNDEINYKKIDRTLIKPLPKTKFKSTNILDIIKENISGVRCPRNKNSTYQNFIFYDDDGEKYYLIGKTVIGNAGSNDKFKLIKTNNIKKFIKNNLDSDIKYVEVNYKHGIWLIGCLNSSAMFDIYKNTFKTTHTETVKQHTQKQQKLIKMHGLPFWQLIHSNIYKYQILIIIKKIIQKNLIII